MKVGSEIRKKRDGARGRPAYGRGSLRHNNDNVRLSHLTEDIANLNVRVPMGMLTTLVGDTVPFRWNFTHRGFEKI
jgi:hypothetical protein